MEGCPSNLKIPCNIGHVHVEKAYIDLNSPLNIMTQMMEFHLCHRLPDCEDISSIIDPRLSQVVLGKPFVEISNMTHGPPKGVVRFTNGTNGIAYKMPYKIEQYNSLLDLEKEHTKSVCLRNKEDKRRGVEYVMSKILGFYKECLELGLEYVTGMDDEEEVTLRSLVSHKVTPGINVECLIPSIGKDSDSGLLVKMDDPNITMKEYIRLEEENAHRRGKVYNWETATYGKIWYDEDVHDLRSVKTEFPTIVFDDAFTSEVTPSYEPTVSPLNDNKINFRILFDESDNEDYTVIYDKNSLFSVYNDALTSKLDFLTEPALSPQHIDEFDLKDETSLFECDEDEQNVLYFNDLFLFNVIYPDDSKSNKDYDDYKIDIKQSSGHSRYDVFIKRIQRIRHKYQYGVSWGIDTAYRFPVQFLGPRWKEIDNIGGVFINLEISKCWTPEISRR
ncbi:hypothetical protein Tco_0731928, partial [Tanacetum coccineum]